MQMRDRPAQSGDRHFTVHPLENVEQMMHGAIVVPVNGQRHSLGSGPERHPIKLVLVSLGWIFVVVHAPGDAFADAVEAQSIVTGAHGEKLRVGVKILQLLARTWREYAVDD